MNGIHDMGGMHGFGPVEREENEPVFHEPWEARMVAMRAVVGRAPDLRPGQEIESVARGSPSSQSVLESRCSTSR